MFNSHSCSIYKKPKNSANDLSPLENASKYGPFADAQSLGDSRDVTSHVALQEEMASTSFDIVRATSQKGKTAYTSAATVRGSFVTDDGIQPYGWCSGFRSSDGGCSGLVFDFQNSAISFPYTKQPTNVSSSGSDFDGDQILTDDRYEFREVWKLKGTFKLQLFWLSRWFFGKHVKSRAMVLMVERNRGEHLIRRFAGRGNEPDPRDVKIASLKQRIHELEFPQLQQNSPTKEVETESNVWDDGSEDVNPFAGGNPRFHDDHYDNPLLTKEPESEPIIWDIGDEEEEGFGEEEDTSEDTELREHHTDDKDCDETHTRQILDHSVAELFHQDLHGQMLCLREKVKERLRISEDDVHKRIAPMDNKLGFKTIKLHPRIHQIQGANPGNGGSVSRTDQLSGTDLNFKEESIDSGFARSNTIITSLKALDEGFSNKNYVRKFLRALHSKWRAKVMAIEESKYLSSLALYELIAKKEYSDDETSTSKINDEEYVMAVRNFKKFFRRKGNFVRQPREEKKSLKQRDEKKGKSDWKCFRCGDPNYLIEDYPKPSHSKYQKAFIGDSWSDSENDAEDKTNDETCLMAQSSNEVTLNSSYYSDNASSLDNDNMQIDYDSLQE
nr:paired amphipathic helix protein Sin3-like 4 isoform X2 [Tanacetum cinerariifolium]